MPTTPRATPAPMPCCKRAARALSVILYYAVILLLASLVINLAGPDFVQYAMAMSGY